MRSTALKLFPVLALALLTVAATGCVTERTPRRSLEPTWSYHDKPDPLAHSDVWNQPAVLTEAQVAQMRDELQR